MPYSQYSPKQRKLAALAPPRKKITRADLLKLRKRGGKAINVKRAMKSDRNKLRKKS